VHLPAPAGLNVPAAQGWHAGWPIEEYEPAWHSAHDDACWPEKRPAAQGEHRGDPAPAKLPAAQSQHARLDPMSSEDFPAEQATHVVAFVTGPNFPASQAMHAPPCSNFPSLQARQLALLSWVWNPAAQLPALDPPQPLLCRAQRMQGLLSAVHL